MALRLKTTIGLLVLAGMALGALWFAKERPVAPQGPAEVMLLRHRQPTEQEVAANFTGALFEPPYGCYLGAYIDLDPALKQTYHDQNDKYRRIPAEFESKVGRKHANYFFYLGYGRPVPMDWLKKLAGWGYDVHIALEPNDGLDAVKDDAFLNQFGKDLAASGARVFLRFASEMNGPWVKYNGNPPLYVEKWRLLTTVIRRHAKNVAMLWCPYTTPRSTILPYYPGDEWVDWVGINLYNVTYYSMKWYQPGYDDHPIDLLTWIYRRYAERKPIMICEYGAANYSALEDANVVPFAVECIRTLYSALPAKFPRVKCITYFNTNNLQLKHRRNNDYTVTKGDAVNEAYREAVADPYFIAEPHAPSFVPDAPMPVQERETWSGKVELLLWGRSPERRPVMTAYLDERPLYRTDRLDRWAFDVDTRGLSNGEHQLRVECARPNGQLTAVAEYTVVVANE
ncbi:MAG: hypothetical protein HONBIEJF_02017 [Fimbriimonadaceae bacterium]|nr:hypothetical protein [Fimbriimonadaceae bacterium]